MMLYKSEDVFNENDVPEMVHELTELKKYLSTTSDIFKPDIIICYYKDRSIKLSHLKSNPILANLILLNTAKTSHIESLFDCCRKKQYYLNGYQDYIRNYFAAK